MAVGSQVVLLLSLLKWTIITGDIIIQGQGNCGSQQNPLEIYLPTQPEETITSQAGQFYVPGQDCVVTVTGQPKYQFEVTIVAMDITSDSPDAATCRDYLKIYNGPRVDNARQITPLQGLCGSGSLTEQLRRPYKTSQNFITFRFKSDTIYETRKGFNLLLRQYPWASPAIPNGMNPGGWNDGTKNEFQDNWDNQDVVPGDIWHNVPDYEYDYDRYGFSCYECSYCSIRWFDPQRDGHSTRKGCYMCSKEWEQEFASAKRRCYGQSAYRNLLLSLRGDGGDTVTSYSGCRTFVDAFGKYVNYCFCSGELCNGAPGVNDHGRRSLIITFTLSAMFAAKLL